MRADRRAPLPPRRRERHLTGPRTRAETFRNKDVIMSLEIPSREVSRHCTQPDDHVFYANCVICASLTSGLPKADMESCINQSRLFQCQLGRERSYRRLGHQACLQHRVDEFDVLLPPGRKLTDRQILRRNAQTDHPSCILVFHANDASSPTRWKRRGFRSDPVGGGTPRAPDCLRQRSPEIPRYSRRPGGCAQAV